MPGLLLNILGLINPTMRELIEMQYQFEEPFIVDSSKITTKLGVHATPTDQAVADTLDTYRAGPSPRRPHPPRTARDRANDMPTKGT